MAENGEVAHSLSWKGHLNEQVFIKILVGFVFCKLKTNLIMLKL